MDGGVYFLPCLGLGGQGVPTQQEMGPLMQFESALPSLTKHHAAPSQGWKKEDAEVASKLLRRGLAQAPFFTP